MEECPNLYYQIGDECAKCADASDCPPGSGSEEVIIEEEEANDFESGPVPFPFTGLTVIGMALFGATKLIATSINFFASCVGIWGFLCPVSWIALIIYIPTEHIDRRLLDFDSDSEDYYKSVGVTLIITGFCVNFVLSVMFTLYFLIKISLKDPIYIFWRKLHRINSSLVPCLSFIVSFHCIRLLYCAMFNLDACKAVFEKKVQLLRVLTIFTYASIIGTIFMIISGQIVLLSVFSVT